MKQVECPDCGTKYAVNLRSCPECGCPNDHWENDVEGLAEDEDIDEAVLKPERAGNEEDASEVGGKGGNQSVIQPQQASAKQTSSIGSTDWANYVYECGLLFWHCISRRYFKTSGRATRREFWSFIVILNIILGGPVIYTHVVQSGQGFLASNPGPMFTPAEAIIFIICLIPLITVWVRRMHDIGKSGWWCLVPYADLFLALKKSDEGANEYGEPAKDDI